MENKQTNSLLIVIICILVVILLVVIGWVIGSKFSNKEDSGLNNNNSNNTVEDGKLDNSNNTQNNQEKDYDINESTKLVDIYAGLVVYDENNLGDYYKAIIAYNNLDSSKIKEVYNCEELLGDTCNGTNSWKQVSYNDMNETYKYFFGKNSNLSKKDYTRRGGINLSYSSTNDLFVSYSVNMTGMNLIYAYKVNDAKVSGNELKVNVSCSGAGISTVGKFKSPYTGVEYNIGEEQSFADSEAQHFAKYNFIFEYEDNHYILKNIVKQ